MKCDICPRKCNIDRDSKLGFCGVTYDVKIARADLHMWEEPCISGTNGSGTIFFSGCNLRCVYCQNHEISDGAVGKTISIEELADKMLMLADKGANNINLITPSHYIYQICEAIGLAKKRGLLIPIVYNTSAYEKADAIKSLEGLVDVYLPDFKYYSDELAMKYSRAADYKEVATLAIDEMLRQQPQAVFDQTGIMQRGLIVRHLILPGNTKDSKNVIKYLHDRYGDKIYISIMNQYTPVGELKGFEELSRTITQREYDKVVDYALSLGVSNGFIQEGDTAKESFIPPFGEQ